MTGKPCSVGDESSASSPSTDLIFFVNGKKVVEGDADPEWTLLYYLRNKLGLCGTKLGCGEGGCGACTVSVSKLDRLTKRVSHLAVNACLTPVCAVHGAAVTTVEGLGSVRTKLHSVQQRLAASHGSQCGFCTPGFIMSMYALLRTTPLPTMDEIERCFQGNLCRCTGYRPILEGFRTFSKEYCCGGSKNGVCCQTGEGIIEAKGLLAMEDFAPYEPSQEVIFPPELMLDSVLDEQDLEICGNRVTWQRPAKLQSLIEIKNQTPGARIVCGNTEVGLEMKFRQLIYPALIYPSSVKELHHLTVDGDGVHIGGSVTLSEMEEFFSQLILEKPKVQTRTLVAINKMLTWFAGKQIRNVAALSGNIMTGSPISDLNPILMAVGARLHLQSTAGDRWVQMDGNFFTAYRKNIVAANEIIRTIFIPFTKENEYVFAFKQSRRRDDDIAIVNAGMRIKFSCDKKTCHIDDVALAFGGMAPTTVFAKKTMEVLRGREWKSSIVDTALDSLIEDLPLLPSAPGGMVTYRQSLCLGFFFKFYNFVCKELFSMGVANRLETSVIRELAHGPIQSTQVYEDVNPEQNGVDLVGRPVQHMSALKQVTGEAIYCDDMPRLENELYLALVTSTRAHAKIVEIDESEALQLDGVVAFFSAKDLTEEQNSTGVIINDEQIFARDKVTCYGQVIGCVVATDQALAQRAAKKIKVLYEDIKPLIVTIEDAIQHDSFYHPFVLNIKNGNVATALAKSEHVIEGEIRIGGQEHFYLETNVTIAVPRDGEEMGIYCATQNPNKAQLLVASALGIPANRVVCYVKRLGGGFGGKESRYAVVTLPVAIAAHRLNRPVRCMLDRDEDMVATGFRHPFLGRYKLGSRRDGTITALEVDLFSNAGHTLDLSCAVMERALLNIDNSYRIPDIRATGVCCKTNLPSNTAFRGFGGPQGMMVTEAFIDHLARHLDLDPVEVRRKNLYNEGDKTHFNQTLDECSLKRCFEECYIQSGYSKRRAAIADMNRTSRWKKRGLSLIPTTYGIAFTATFLNQAGALVLVYQDGSVLLSHGGTEMGQGLHTKMIQVVSGLFTIPVDLIHICDTATDKVPNASATAGSASSDLNGMAVIDACQKILARLAPYKEANPDGQWKDWVSAAYYDRVSLSATGFYKTPDLVEYNYEMNQGRPFNYFSYGAACAEVEVDCLTGDHKVIRTDIIMDVGKSLNPAIDIGQIEGAFMQGYGLFVLEELMFSPEGVLLTRGPSNYKIPSCNDMPLEFNVTLLKGGSNPKAIYSSKAVGEPPLFLAASVFHAIKDAVASARKDANLHGSFRLDSPATAERIRMACGDKFTSKNGASSSAFDPEDESTQHSITMIDVLQQQQELEENANAVLGGSDDKNCTYSKGYVGRQALYACKTCPIKSNERAGVCLACSLNCHDGHDLVELYTKRNFRCDCGNEKFGAKECTLEPIKDATNEKNEYNHNFDGNYCTCSRPYPDPEGDDDVMIQCIVCEDWLHAKHSDAVIPADDDYEEMICQACFGKSELLQLYYGSRVGGTSEVGVTATCMKPPPQPEESGWKSGAVFFPGHWRDNLCHCSDCKVIYGKLEFLLDPEDEVKNYEVRGRESRLSEYDQGMQALSSMDRVQQIEVLHEYNSLKTDLVDYLKQFAEQKRVVSEDDIHRFFDELREKKRRRLDSDVVVPSSCR